MRIKQNSLIDGNTLLRINTILSLKRFGIIIVFKGGVDAFNLDDRKSKKVNKINNSSCSPDDDRLSPIYFISFIFGLFHSA